MSQIKIGTLIEASKSESVIPQISVHGFETFSITFWKTVGDMDVKELGKKLLDYLVPRDIKVSSLSIFSNPLGKTGAAEDAIRSWELLIDNAEYFCTDLVTGFTGRIEDQPVDKCIPEYKAVFSELAKRASSKGIRLAFENCSMNGNWKKGSWNIAHDPSAWELMFDAIPDENIGLQWEPCHQLVNLIDPIPQLRKWVGRIFNVHGKDATIAWDIVREYGINGPKRYAWHRTPGFGDSNWTDIISILKMNGYSGSIDIEGYHDPVYRGESELTGQIHALNYLKRCRGGEYVENPDAWKI